MKRILLPILLGIFPMHTFGQDSDLFGVLHLYAVSEIDSPISPENELPHTKFTNTDNDCGDQAHNSISVTSLSKVIHFLKMNTAQGKAVHKF